MLFTEGMKTHLLFKYYSNQQYQDLHGIQPTYQYLHDKVPSARVPVGLSRVVVLKPKKKKEKKRKWSWEKEWEHFIVLYIW